MRHLAFVFVGLFVTLTLSGCAHLVESLDGPECLDAATRATAYNDAKAFIDEEMFDIALTAAVEGTIEGEIDSIVISLDPGAQAILLQSNDMDMRFRFPDMSYEDAEDSFSARNHDPAAWSEIVGELLFDDGPGVGFADERVLGDYDVRCVELGGREAIEFRYEDESDGVTQLFIVERHAPHRLLSGRNIDPALQDNFRISFSYGRPNIQVDSSLPRVPITWDLEIESTYQNTRGGAYVMATFTDATEWAPFSQLEFHLLDERDGTVYVSEPLDDGAWDLGDGDYFEFQDRDSNRMLSAGDRMIMDIGPGLDITYYDTWAGDYTQ